MAQTKEGGQVYKQRMIEKFGSEEAWKEYLRGIAAKGGKNGNTGGFHANRELARIAGARAGKLSKIGHKYIETKRGYSYYLAKDTGKVVKYKHDSTNKRQTSND